MNALPTSNGRPAPQVVGKRSAAVTAAVCLASAAALIALSAGGRPWLPGTPLRLYTDGSAPEEEASLEHYQAVARRRGGIVWPLADSTGAVAPPDAAALAAGPSMEALAREMTARALELFAAAPDRVQLRPQASSVRRSEGNSVEEGGSGGSSTADNSTSLPGILGQAPAAAEQTPQPVLHASQFVVEAAAFAEDIVSNATGSNGFDPAAPQPASSRWVPSGRRCASLMCRAASLRLRSALMLWT